MPPRVVPISSSREQQITKFCSNQSDNVPARCAHWCRKGWAARLPTSAVGSLGAAAGGDLLSVQPPPVKGSTRAEAPLTRRRLPGKTTPEEWEKRRVNEKITKWKRQNKRKEIWCQTQKNKNHKADKVKHKNHKVNKAKHKAESRKSRKGRKQKQWIK